MSDRHDILRFPGSFRCPPDDGEAWEVYEELLKNEDYPGLVEFCQREVVRDPEDLHAQERMGEAYVLDGQYHKAIVTMGEVHRKFPDIDSFQHLILDALFAAGKTENDYDWVLEPSVLRISRAVLDDCHEYLRPKLKPRDVAELSFELMKAGCLTFSDEELLRALAEDGRFVIESGRVPGWEQVRVRRKREDGISAVHRW